MQVSARYQRAMLSAGADAPQAGLVDKPADAGQRYGQGLIGKHLPGDYGIDRQNQLEIFAIAQGMVERRRAIGQLDRERLGGGCDRNALQVQNRAASRARSSDRPSLTSMPAESG